MYTLSVGLRNLKLQPICVDLEIDIDLELVEQHQPPATQAQLDDDVDDDVDMETNAHQPFQRPARIGHLKLAYSKAEPSGDAEMGTIIDEQDFKSATPCRVQATLSRTPNAPKKFALTFFNVLLPALKSSASPRMVVNEMPQLNGPSYDKASLAHDGMLDRPSNDATNFVRDEMAAASSQQLHNAVSPMPSIAPVSCALSLPAANVTPDVTTPTQRSANGTNSSHNEASAVLTDHQLDFSDLNVPAHGFPSSPSTLLPAVVTLNPATAQQQIRQFELQPSQQSPQFNSNPSSFPPTNNGSPSMARRTRQNTSRPKRAEFSHDSVRIEQATKPSDQQDRPKIRKAAKDNAKVLFHDIPEGVDKAFMNTVAATSQTAAPAPFVPTVFQPSVTTATGASNVNSHTAQHAVSNGPLHTPVGPSLAAQNAQATALIPSLIVPAQAAQQSSSPPAPYVPDNSIAAPRSLPGLSFGTKSDATQNNTPVAAMGTS